MLEFQGCVFRQGTFELSVEWTLPTGSLLAVVGPSGSGKSTLLGGIAGFLEQSAGHLLLDGAALTQSADKRPVAMLFQDHNLFPHLSIAQNVGLGLRPVLSLDAAEQGKVRAALASVGLEGMESRKPSELSGGQQSRAAIARMLVMARPVLLLDEPFSALGPAQRREMLDLVKDIAGKLGATVIMVTHDPDEAERLGGLVSFVEDGRAAPPVPVVEFFANPPAGMRRYTGES